MACVKCRGRENEFYPSKLYPPAIATPPPRAGWSTLRIWRVKNCPRREPNLEFPWDRRRASSIGHRPVGDNLRSLEELIAPNVVRVLVRNEHVFGIPVQTLPEHLDHLTRMTQSDCVSIKLPRLD